MNPGRIIVQIEKARSKLLAVDPVDREKLVSASRKVDRLVVEYYRAKLSGKNGRGAVSGQIGKAGAEEMAGKRALSAGTNSGEVKEKCC